jgi:hypothetical protein
MPAYPGRCMRARCPRTQAAACGQDARVPRPLPCGQDARVPGPLPCGQDARVPGPLHAGKMPAYPGRCMRAGCPRTRAAALRAGCPRTLRTGRAGCLRTRAARGRAPFQRARNISQTPFVAPAGMHPVPGIDCRHPQSPSSAKLWGKLAQAEHFVVNPSLSVATL